MKQDESYNQGLDALNAASAFNAQMLLISRVVSGVATAKIVKVISCTNAGGISPVGTVSVQPLVNQLDGFGNAVPHGQLYSLPYHRLQGGTNAIILDPMPGDIGVAIFCDRDSSSVKRSRIQANPASRRMHDMADGLYLGGFLNGVPSQFIAFTSAGIEITTPGAITLTSATLTHNGVNIGATHVHGNVQNGEGETSPPVG